jgi:Ca2+-binding EF-hand superfamily protein
MSRKLTIAALAAAALALPAAAADFSEVDADSDGRITLEELQTIAPDVTEDGFSAYDRDLDGALIQVEFDAWSAANEEGQTE